MKSKRQNHKKNSARQKYFNRRHSSKKRRPNFIYGGDLCFFSREQKVYPATENFEFSKDIMRVIWPGEHLRYIKRLRRKHKGPWLHCFESYGHYYVFDGSIKEFTKKPVPYKENELCP